MTNRLEQNKQIIAELRAIGSKLDRLEAKINSGVNVKVTSMPAIQVNGGEKERKPKGDEAPPATGQAPAPRQAPSK